MNIQFDLLFQTHKMIKIIFGQIVFALIVAKCISARIIEPECIKGQLQEIVCVTVF